MKEFCENVVEELNHCSIEDWAEKYVNFKLKFCREYFKGLIFSTAHGINFFDNVLGGKWPEFDPVTKVGESGELGDNFRKLLKQS